MITHVLISLLLVLICTPVCGADSTNEQVRNLSEMTSLRHDELVALATSGRLVTGRQYRITDFHTRHTIPNTQSVNTGPTEVLVATALGPSALTRVVQSERYPADIIEYELINTLDDRTFDRGRITFRRDPVKEISSFEDWRAVKYRRGKNPLTGKFTETVDFSHGQVDRFPFNNAPDPPKVTRVHVGRPNGSQLSNVVIGTGVSTVSADITVGQGCNTITIGDNTDIVEIGQVNGNITIGDGSHHIRIGVCSDYAYVGDGCSYVNIGTQSTWITVANNVGNCTVGDNVRQMTIGNGSPLVDVYIGNGVYIDPPPVIAEAGTLERYHSTIPATVDISGRNYLDLDHYSYAGTIMVTNSKKDATVERIIKKAQVKGNDLPIELRPLPGLKLRVGGTSPERITSDGQILHECDLVLNGDVGDSVTLVQRMIGTRLVFVVTRKVIYQHGTLSTS